MDDLKDKINSCTHVEELIKVLRDNPCTINGSWCRYTSFDMSLRMMDMNADPKCYPVNYLTRSLGIRRKYMELSGLYDINYINLMCASDSDA